MAFASPIPRAQFDIGQFITQVSQQIAQPAPQTNAFQTNGFQNAFDPFFRVQPTQSGSGGGYGPRPGGTRKPGYRR